MQQFFALPDGHGEILAAVKSIIGQTVTALRYRKFHTFGLECLALTSTHSTVVFRAAELDLGKYETYSLHASTVDDVRDGESLAIEATITGVELWARDEWLEPGIKTADIIGNFPMTLKYGPLGSAPQHVTSQRVISACLAMVEEAKGYKPLMIHTATYPGLISYSAVAEEIDEFCRTSTLCCKC